MTGPLVLTEWTLFWLCPPPAACQFPRRDDFLRAILRSGDAATGPDGCPLRMLPARDIVCGLALTLCPRPTPATMRITFRLLDMSDTAVRLIDSAVFMCMCACEPCQAEALINTLKKAPANFLDNQDRLLDPRRTLLSCSRI